jgi:hypothetical protein
MVSEGGRIYQPRGPAFDVNTTTKESCLDCHGTGKTWAIDAVH